MLIINKKFIFTEKVPLSIDSTAFACGRGTILKNGGLRPLVYSSYLRKKRRHALNLRRFACLPAFIDTGADIYYSINI